MVRCGCRTRPTAAASLLYTANVQTADLTSAPPETTAELQVFGSKVAERGEECCVRSYVTPWQPLNAPECRKVCRREERRGIKALDVRLWSCKERQQKNPERDRFWN